MKTILLIGLGRFGRHLAENLSTEDCEVLCVDSREDRIVDVLPVVHNAMIGDCTNRNFLKSLEVSEFDTCIVAIGSDFQSSLVCTSLLKELGAKKVVARAAEDLQARILSQIGADDIIYPEKQIAAWAAKRYTADHIFDYIKLQDNYGIFEIEIPEEWIGKTIGQIDIRKKYKMNIMAIKTDTELTMNITSETTFKQKDRILVLGNNKDISKYFHL